MDYHHTFILVFTKQDLMGRSPGLVVIDGRPNSGRKSFLLNKMGPSIVTLSKSTSSEFDLKHNFITVYFVTLAGTNTVKNFFSAHR